MALLKWLSKRVWLLSTLSLRLTTNLEEGTYLDALVPSWQVLPPHLQRRMGHVQVRTPLSWCSVLLSHHWEASFWEEALNWLTHLYNCIFGHIKISPCNKERHFSYGLTGRKEVEKVLLISRVRSQEKAHKYLPLEHSLCALGHEFGEGVSSEGAHFSGDRMRLSGCCFPLHKILPRSKVLI